jgi:NFU1 iron-sulfur cluster scaffold homolog, mitochondrial
MDNKNEITKIEEILNSTIRPSIKQDGGDLSIISYENNVLKINYEGACVGCPMAKQGTLQAIEQVLKENYNPEITVQAD